VNEYLLLAWLVGRRYRDSFEAEFGERISKMSQFLSDLKPPEGRVPQIGDSDDGLVVGFDPSNRADPFEELLSAVAWIGEPQGPKTTQKAFWYGLLYDACYQADDTLPPIRAFDSDCKIYADGGYVVFRDRSMHAVFDAGSLGYPSIAAHGHADALSLCLSLNGHWWLVDPGTYCYHTEPLWRDYFRSTGAHNTALINATDQSLMGGAFLWLKHARAKLDSRITQEGREAVIGGEVVGYAHRNKVHRRVIRFNRERMTLVIEDSIGGGEADSFELRFHFHPDVQLAQVSGSHFQAVHARQPGKLLVNADDQLSWRIVKGEESPPLGWYSETLGEKVPCCVLVGDGECSTVASTRVTLDWSGIQH
jgi:hypothetical protein